MAFTNRTRTEKTIQVFVIHIAVIIVIAFIVAAGLTSYVITMHSAKEMQNKVVKLIHSSNSQQIDNVNLYLEKVEDTAALFFSDKSYYEYDATAENVDEFERIQQQKMLQKRIEDLSVLQNFSDFGVVYSNDVTVGWISNTIVQMFPKGGLYDYMSSRITDDKTESGWFFDYDKCYDRVYYVKLLNENAILVTAFYSREFASIFNVPEGMEQLQICLVDDKGTILYADDTALVGKDAKDQIPELDLQSEDYQILGKDNVVTKGLCKNDWSVICTIPTDVLFAEESQFARRSAVVAIAMICVIILLGMFLSFQASKRAGNVFHSITKRADYDQLTGLLNKASYQEVVESHLSRETLAVQHVFLMLDMDNFKLVNDRLGHQAGDEALHKVAKAFRDIFDKEAVLGRVGGDEFSIYLSYAGTTYDRARTDVERKLDQLFERFATDISSQYEECRLALSVGGYQTWQRMDLTYEEMYQNADKALYVSKRSGKHQYNWYEDGEKL